MELNGMTALVTGGADGIGAGIAERLAADGMHVVIADLDERSGLATAERIGGSFLRTDLADPAGVHAAVARVRRGQGGRGQVHHLPGAAA
jgi:NAD(P)-dependent dehydrogenase (short-subunit alcohol dehydrogenase family)